MARREPTWPRLSTFVYHAVLRRSARLRAVSYSKWGSYPIVKPWTGAMSSH
jgi:hypothetical protein